MIQVRLSGISLHSVNCSVLVSSLDFLKFDARFEKDIDSSCVLISYTI